MAITLASSLKKKSDSKTSFDVTFSQNKTYDLDEISKQRDRKQTGTELLIGIKYDSDISEAIWNKMNSDVTTKIKATLENDMDVSADIQNMINSIVQKIFLRYDCDYRHIPTAAQEELNREITQGLRRYYNENGIVFSISFSDSNSAEVKWDYASDSVFSARFNDYYLKYASDYDVSLGNVGEGGLSISDLKKKQSISDADYRRYLIDNNKTSTVCTSKRISGRRPIIILEEGTEDSNTGDSGETIYDMINDLADTITEYEDMIAEYNKKISEYQSIEKRISSAITDDSADTDLATIGAIKSYVSKYAYRTQYSFDDSANELSGDFKAMGKEDGTYEIYFKQPLSASSN